MQTCWLILWLVSIPACSCLMCHVCTSATDLSSCQATTMCTAGQVCSTEVSHMGNKSVYSMGCSDLQCGAPVGPIMGPVIGRSVDARQAAAPYCQNCCAASGCNLNICRAGNDTYRLFYFDIRGRGELTRMIFKYMDQPFTDIRINFQDWPAIKYTFPQYVIPVLEVNGRLNITQSMAIVRYLARKYDLYGRTEMEMAYVDQLIETSVDLFAAVQKFALIQDPQENAVKKAEFMKTDAPKYLGFLEDLVKAGGHGHFAVGNAFTVADLLLYVYVEASQAQKTPIESPLLANYTRLANNRKYVEQIPNIAAYLASRPVTPI